MTDSLFISFYKLYEKSKSDPVFFWDSKWYDRADFYRLLIFIARIFRENNVAKNDFIIFYGGNHPIALALPFVCSFFKVTYLPIADTTPFQIAVQLHHTYKAKIIITDSEKEDRIDFLSAKELWKSFNQETYEVNSENGKISEGSFQIAFSTSGSSGTPKLILLNEAHLLANIQAATKGQELSSDDTILASLSICHSGGLCIQVLPAICVGAKIILRKQFNAKQFISDTLAFDVTVTLIVPSHFKLIQLSPSWDEKLLLKYRLIGIGSAKLDKKLVDDCVRLRLPLMNIYGLTEAGPFAIYGWVSKFVESSANLGKPAHGIEVLISPLTNGKIFLRGDAVQPVLLDCGKLRKLVDEVGWFDTGDQAVEIDDEYYFTARESDILNIGGLKVNTSKVEDVLNTIRGVSASAVFSRNHAVFNEILVACLEVKDKKTLSRKNVSSFCKAHLPRHMVPRNIYIVSNFPKSSVGKILKSELKKAYG